MNTQFLSTPSSTTQSTPDHLSPLRDELRKWQALLEAQPPLVQRYLETQAALIADAYFRNDNHIAFTLPERICPATGAGTVPVPDAFRRGSGGVFHSLGRAAGRAALRRQLDELEGNADAAVASAAGLLRYTTAAYMVYSVLPSGRHVVYDVLEGETIPSVPVAAGEAASALTAETDAIAEESGAEGGEVIVPYVPAARRFYMPQWVAFDDDGQLLVNSGRDAEAVVASMKQFVGILHGAVAIAPYFVADEEYRRKRYGILGQLVNQGRALARYQTAEIVKTIQVKASSGALNRGLSLSLPYFDDQALELRLHDFQVIPRGRIMFVPAFVVRAANLEQAKVAQDTRLGDSTRKYLMQELQMLADAFSTPLA